MSGGSLGQDCAARFREVSIARRDAEEDSRQTWNSVLGDHCPSFPGASEDSVDPDATETSQIWRWKTTKTPRLASAHDVFWPTEVTRVTDSLLRHDLLNVCDTCNWALDAEPDQEVLIKRSFFTTKKAHCSSTGPVPEH